MSLMKGMDVSMLRELEECGAKYYFNEEEMDIFQIFSKTGVNAVRLRLWHTPFSKEELPYGGGTNDLLTTILLAQRIMRYGLDFILDIHYSDFWTDPKKQIKPKAWENLHGVELENAVYNYTKKVLNELKAFDIKTKYVQVGNEITKGFLWPDGHIENHEGMVKLLRAGIQAVKEFDPDIKIILHLDYGTDNALYREWFHMIEPYHLEFDIIGMSYYPYWNGDLQSLLFNMNDISKTFGKDIIVAETAFGYTSDSFGCKGMIFSDELAETVPYEISKEGQKHFMKDLMNTLHNVEENHGLGFIYWEPSWLPIKECTWATKEGCVYTKDEGEIGNSWANQALFDENGKANPVFELFNE